MQILLFFEAMFYSPESVVFYIKRQENFFTIYYMGIQGVTGNYRELQGVTRGFRGFQRVIRGYRG